ncbi:MAG: NAD-glutamate dehydrogenase, partial [Pseudomonadota bacterium]|nr:NAD-glutamate dehydrogenase [Pseudomonadota bacterium]
TAVGIWHLQERRQIRLFARKDAYGRYVSCLVYLPREKFNTQLINRMQTVLMNEFHGLEVNYDTFFPESVLARIHYVIRTDPKKKHEFDPQAVEQKLIEVGQSWHDNMRLRLIERYGEEEGIGLYRLYQHTFPAGYRETFKSNTAVYDVAYIEELRAGGDIAMSFYRPQSAEPGVLRFKLYRYDESIPLSDAIPMLENMGLRVMGEQPYELKLDGRVVWLNDFLMYYREDTPMNVDDIKERFQIAFYKVWKGVAGNDSFNRLVLAAKLSWTEVRILRAYAKHLHQTGFPLSQHYIESAFTNNPDIARDVVSLFMARFDPTLAKNREKIVQEILEKIQAALQKVSSLDEDRIIHRYLDVIQATLRTNYFQMDAAGHHKNYLSYKIDPKMVPELPLPLPMFEAFVYSTRFEGVHLRGANVARGGIRWSDRRDDFRTEVLGLMKAQQVKNAVIVPYGAKGGFVPKRLPVDGSREAIMQEGIACYQDYVRGLLDLVDNLENGNV